MLATRGLQHRRPAGPGLRQLPAEPGAYHDAAVLVRALLTADRNQHYLRLQMSERQRGDTGLRLRPFIIADAGIGHGGDPHGRNLIRPLRRGRCAGLLHRGPTTRHQEVRAARVSVLVPSDEQIKRLNAARFQLDIMRVPGITSHAPTRGGRNLDRQSRRRA